MSTQLIKAAELRTTAGGSGIEGRYGVSYVLSEPATVGSKTYPAGTPFHWEASGTMVADGGPAAEFTDAEAAALQALVAGGGITADDTGSAWTLCPSLLSISATLTAGSSTTVLLEVRTAAGVVTTAATIVADTTSQTLRQAFLTRESYEYRFRRSSGTGTVVIYL